MDEESRSYYYHTRIPRPDIVRCTKCGRVYDGLECPECGFHGIWVVKPSPDVDELEEAYDNLYDIIDEDLAEKEE
jgi:predicted  nucleic acid-binding Zn-ribbon protein